MGMRFVVACDGPGCQERLEFWYDELDARARTHLAESLSEHATCERLETYCDDCEGKRKARGIPVGFKF